MGPNDEGSEDTAKNDDEPVIAPNRRGSVFGFSMEPARFEVERPVRVTPPKAFFGSDLVVETLRELDVPFVAMKSGAALGELRDSLVNYLGNTRPQLLSCLDESAALSIAHGYAKASGRPMAVALSQSTLLSPGSAIASARRDALPMIVLQAGPASQGSNSHSLLADFAPRTPAEARYAILQANRIAQAQPQGPVRVTLPVEVLAAPVDPLDPRRNLDRYRARVSNGAGRAEISELAAMLLEAERPLILAGRVSRSAEGWQHRVILAELLGARVHAAAAAPAAFPTDHPLFLPEIEPRDLWQSDLLLSLDWPDLAAFTRGSYRERNPNATIAEVSPDVSRKLACGSEGSTPTPSDILIEAAVDQVVAALIEEMGDISSTHQTVKPATVAEADGSPAPDAPLCRSAVSHALVLAAKGRALCLASVPPGWPTGAFSFSGPLDYLGAGPGTPAKMVGSALALVGSECVTAGIIDAADFVSAASALWTAAHYRIPLLLVVLSEEAPQSEGQVATARGRTVDNAWIGRRVSGPEISISSLAATFGALGLDAGPDYNSLTAVLGQGIAHVDEGGVAVINVQLP